MLLMKLYVYVESVAQVVGRRTRGQKVPGSNPETGLNFKVAVAIEAVMTRRRASISHYSKILLKSSFVLFIYLSNESLVFPYYVTLLAV